MKKFFFFATILLLFACSASKNEAKSANEINDVKVRMLTTAGTIELLLYDETPKHRDNFIRLVREQRYDSLLFHRVIKDFMIQGGDPESKSASAGAMLGEGDLGYRVQAEFLPQKYFHRRGALAAAREGDAVNPGKASSACQFYIVWGKVYTPEELQTFKNYYKRRFGREINFTDEQQRVYTTIGGTPHLDGDYTVFGEVTSGLEVVDRIQNVPCDRNDRPLEDIRIIKVEIIE